MLRSRPKQLDAAGLGETLGMVQPMRWLVLAPFLQTSDQPWIHQQIRSPLHAFDIVTADYVHDRSRRTTSGRQWLDYFRHAWRGWRAWRLSAGGTNAVGLITAFPQLAVCAGLIGRLTNRSMPIVAWSFNLGQRYGGLKGRLARFALAHVDLFVVFSRRERDTYSDMLSLPRERFVFVPFTEEMVAPDCLEEAGEPFILAMGTANRDYASLLEAVGSLGLRTVIVAGPHAVSGMGIPACVTIRSGLTLAQCHALCQQARINVVPLDTDQTASGQVTVRYAMMFAKATIATISIGTEDYIEDGVTGLLVPPRDPLALAQAIDALWRDGPTRQAMGQAAQDWIRDHAHFDVGPQRLLSCLEQVRMAR